LHSHESVKNEIGGVGPKIVQLIIEEKGNIINSVAGLPWIYVRM
jgi:hypothetical protein